MASATQSRMCLDKRSARGGPQWRVGASSPRWAKLLHGRQAKQITKQLIIKVMVEVGSTAQLQLLIYMDCGKIEYGGGYDLSERTI